jgi:SAM-dependent methyltransferase
MLSQNLNEFVLSRMVCPISKKPLRQEGDDFIAPCGFRYEQGDFRVGLGFQDIWSEGQKHYEEVASKDAASPQGDFELADREVVEVYDRIEIGGDVLDVGGWWGILPKQTSLDITRYAVIDPMVCAWDELPADSKFARHYSMVQSVPRVLGNAEFLPFGDATFDLVHMRSCLDHFANPALALQEAYRVLRPGGRIVIMLALEGTYKKTNPTAKQRLKNVLVSLPGGWALFEWLVHDHHIFHPTYDGLQKLMRDAKFTQLQEVWPSAWHNLIYVEARRD